MNGHLPPLLTEGEVFYLGLLNREDRALYERAPSDPDLAGDIRLLRAVIGRLAENGGLAAKEAAIRQAIGILYRLIQVQTRTAADEDDERAIRSAADAFLAAEEAKAAREDGEDDF